MPDARSRAGHDAHADARNEHAALLRLEALRRQEEHARETTKLKIVTPLTQPAAHEFRTPIPHRYEAAPSGECLDAPGAADAGGFDGCVV